MIDSTKGPKFQRRHYEKIADTLRCVDHILNKEQYDLIVSAFCIMLDSDNPNFNWDRFVNRCDREKS